ncbi:MAG: sugar ABC transporter ATP-binding protein [Lachnospiraceae bacterium]|nr:sugar ABC transporter ATP-binding protein [Lachnospiraceae bacterium]
MSGKNFLRLEKIAKSFAHNLVLKDVHFSIEPGEVRALLGENGAGKSTMIKIIAGVYKPDSGSIYIDEKEVTISNPKEGLDKGISVIYQELDLLPALSVVQNIFLGIERKNNLGMLDKVAMERMVQEYFDSMQIDIDIHAKVGELPIASQQMVAIAKAVEHEARLLIMDEPSSSLTNKELEVLYRQIQQLKERNVAVIYISHRLEEVYEICDTVTILRDGVMIDTRNVSEIERHEMVTLMIGREINEDRLNTRKTYDGPVILSARNICLDRHLHQVSFDVKKGEIFGILGLVGSGAIELGKVLYGVIPMDAGELSVAGKKLQVKMPSDALHHSLSYVPDERRAHGIFPLLSVEQNSVITSIYQYTSRFGFLNHKKVNAAFVEYVERFGIKIASPNQPIQYLSGGNQQKALIARTLLSNTEIIILSCPTKGIDVGSKFDIYSILLDCAKEGKTIIAVSQEITELVRICDRILMLKDGEVYHEYTGDEISESLIYHDLLAEGRERR